MQGGTTQDECTDRPDRPETSKKVRSLCVLVAVDDVQFLAAHESEHLAHRGLASAGVTHQQSRLTVLHAPAPHTINSTSCLCHMSTNDALMSCLQKNDCLAIVYQYIDPLADVRTHAMPAARTVYWISA